MGTMKEILWTPFPTDLTEAMKVSNHKAFEQAETDLTKFMSECEAGVSSIDSILLWVQPMSCNDIYHGSTLSSTRLQVMPEFIAMNNLTGLVFSSVDEANVKALDSTMAGLVSGRSVFTREKMGH